MAKVLSRYLKQEFEVASYESQENGESVQVISHEALEDIVHNQIPAEKNVRYDFTDMAITRNHCVIRCTVSDKDGRRVQAIGETVPETLETEISQNYPALMASQRAFDRAVIRYLNIPGKVLSSLENPDKDAVNHGETKVNLDEVAPDKAPVKTGVPASADNGEPKPTAAPVNNAPQKSAGAPQEASGAPQKPQTPVTTQPPAQNNAAAETVKGPGAVVCDVGRYRKEPKTIAAIYAEDPGYLSWINSDKYTATTEKAKALKKACAEFLAIVGKGGK